MISNEANRRCVRKKSWNNRRFGGTWYLQLQCRGVNSEMRKRRGYYREAAILEAFSKSRRIRRIRNQHLALKFIGFECRETGRNTATFCLLNILLGNVNNIHRTTRRYILENSNLHSYIHLNLKFKMPITLEYSANYILNYVFGVYVKVLV
jgi:hypothetical protein